MDESTDSTATRFVSLGVSCLPRYIAQRELVRTRIIDHTRNLPFDYAITPYDCAVSLIRDHYRQMRADRLTITSHPWFNNPVIVHDSLHGCIWPNEFDLFDEHEHWTDERKLLLFTQRMQAAYDRFERALTTPGRLALLLESNQYPGELVALLDQLFPAPDFRIIVLHWEAISMPVDACDPRVGRISLIDGPGSTKVRWWLESFRDSPAGRDWFRTIGRRISDACLDLW